MRLLSLLKVLMVLLKICSIRRNFTHSSPCSSKDCQKYTEFFLNCGNAPFIYLFFIFKKIFFGGGGGVGEGGDFKQWL